MSDILELIHKDVKYIKRAIDGDIGQPGLKTQVAMNKKDIATIGSRHKWIVGTLTALGLSFSIAFIKAVMLKFK